MDVSLVIRHRLNELGLEQRDLATAANVTESYISQLLTGKKAPPIANRTDIYQKMESFLKVPDGQLSKLAERQRIEELHRKLGEPPAPLFKEIRGQILSKCVPEKEKQIRAIFEKQQFGELERLVTQKLLEVIKRVAKDGVESKQWLQDVSRLSNRSYQTTRAMVLGLLDMDIFHLSVENYVPLLDLLIISWNIDLETFSMEVVLNSRLVSEHVKKLEFVEKQADQSSAQEPGLEEFLSNTPMSGDATDEEISFLRQLKFQKKRPTSLYYYRELQNLRDPLHFRTG